MTLMTDREGRVWAGTSAGLTVYDTEATGAGQAASPVLLTHIRIDGREHALPERGTATTALVDLSAGSSVQFEFVSVANGGGRAPRYQYQLEGGDHEWSPPTTDRSVTYARLAPGGYRFLVRAIGADGRASEPATAAFTIPAPIWRRPWFVGLGILATLGAGAAVQRVRVRQVLAMERIRRQVALDLHDDIGSGLSQIAIMSDAGSEHANAGPWAEVGNLARGLRESMSDIVWAVDPRHDSLHDLVRRMRQVSLQMLETDGVTVTFESPAEAEIARLTLAPDRRRHVLLILKEAVHNVARHAGARTVRIAVRVTSGRLELVIADDGRGFDVEAAHDGHGLASLRARAAALGAELHLDSTRGTGTTIRLSLPLS
jgi:signal transduction histidine kinase